MIKTQYSGLEIILTKKDLKKSSKDKMAYDNVSAADFNLPKEAWEKADHIEFISTGVNDVVLCGKTLKNRKTEGVKKLNWVEKPTINPTMNVKDNTFSILGFMKGLFK